METRREVIVRLAQRAEELGYAAFSVAEGWGHDATAVLAEIAVRTERIRIGSNVMNVWGRSPATIAMAAASLADLSGGRYFLGIGAGSPTLAEGLHGVPFRDPVARLESVARQVRRLLDGAAADPTPGSAVRPLRLAVAPAQPVPIAIAALGPKAVDVAGRHADAWTPFFLPRNALASAITDLRAARTSANGDGASSGIAPAVWPGVPVAISDDAERATAAAAWWITFYLTRMGPLYSQTLRRLGYADEVAAVTSASLRAPFPEVARRLVDELTAHGTPEQVRASLDGWFTAGADMPCLVLPPGADPDQLDEILVAMAAPTRVPLLSRSGA